jgi:hypothetical protein
LRIAVPRAKKTEARRALEFALILAGAGVAFAGLALWRHHATRAALFAGAGLGALALALAVRPLWLAFFRAWMKLAEGMGWVMTRVLLTVFYFLLVTPFGLIRRLSGKPTLDTTWRTGRRTYWIDKEPVPSTIERYKKRY